jgi:hypothetical protein
MDGFEMDVPRPLPERVYVPWRAGEPYWAEPTLLPTFPVLVYLRHPRSGRYVHESLIGGAAGR